MIKTDWVADQMPLADDRSRIASGLHHWREAGLGAVEAAVAVVVEAVEVRVLASQDRGATGTTDRIGDQTAIEPHTAFGQTVHVGRFKQLAFIPNSSTLDRS